MSELIVSYFAHKAPGLPEQASRSYVKVVNADDLLKARQQAITSLLNHKIQSHIWDDPLSDRSLYTSVCFDWDDFPDPTLLYQGQIPQFHLRVEHMIFDMLPTDQNEMLVYQYEMSTHRIQIAANHALAEYTRYYLELSVWAAKRARAIADNLIEITQQCMAVLRNQVTVACEAADISPEELYRKKR
jgi:hypothetical protein